MSRSSSHNKDTNYFAYMPFSDYDLDLNCMEQHSFLSKGIMLNYFQNVNYILADFGPKKYFFYGIRNKKY
tara:strand:+ start:2235 stop:2444 length:210 start_codon:yes stop_codon:yes gene_type:complete